MLLRKFARRRRKISKIYAINHRKIGHSKGLEARKFRLFNPNGKKKYILKILAKQTTRHENLNLDTIFTRTSRLMAFAMNFIDL